MTDSASKNKYVYLAAFLTPVLILLVIMICSTFYPIGDNCILKTDMYHQYAPFFSEFREKLQSGGSLKFTWNLGLGVNFAAIMAYYLASPFNWLIAFVGKNYVIEFMTVMIVLKAGLSGAAMSVYLLHKAPEQRFGAYLFSIFYALSGYFCAYYWNVMWLDSIAVFPLVVLGAEKIINRESGLLYGVSLGYCIFSNYYISIMVCIFLVLYFFMFSIVNGYKSFRDFVRAGLRFAAWSLLAGGLAALMLLPEIYALGATASSESNFPKTFTEYFSIIDMLARHLAGVETEQWLQHFPNIYCGTAVLVLFYLYLKNKKIGLKEKSAYVALAIFMLAGFSINVLNFIWHGMRYPNSLPARQSFIYCFLVLVMCFRVFEHRDSINKQDIGTAFLVSAGFIILAQNLLSENDEFHFLVFYVGLLLVALYALILYLYRDGRVRQKFLAIALIVLVIAEAGGNTAATSITMTSRSAYMKNNNEIRTLVSEIEDTDIYRVERVNRKTKDDGAWLGFPSVSIFSSMANKGCSDFFKSIGCESSTNAYSITGSTPFADMLLGVRYAVFDSEQKDAEGKSFVRNEGNAYLYKNDYALPVGYALPSSISGGWMLELKDPTLVQNTFCDELSVGQMLVTVPGGTEESGRYQVTLSEDGEYYAYAAGSKADSATVSWPDKKKTFEHLDRRYLIELGECHKGDLIKINSEDGAALDIRLYRFDYGVLGQIYDKMSENVLKVTEHGDDYIKGTATVDPAALGYSSAKTQMMITTPYDEGWKVTVDGEPVKIYKGLDTFVAFYLTAGTHDIEMHYEPRGIREGMLISGFSLAVVFLYIVGAAVLKRRKKKAEAEAEEQEFDNAEGEAEAEAEVFESLETESDEEIKL
ncbi:MAG: YfhO family protein [Eubacteriales bacterium]|nr:YfhO family protein [Eubacteriales bacterium]